MKCNYSRKKMRQDYTEIYIRCAFEPFDFIWVFYTFFFVEHGSWIIMFNLTAAGSEESLERKADTIFTLRFCSRVFHAPFFHLEGHEGRSRIFA